MATTIPNKTNVMQPHPHRLVETTSCVSAAFPLFLLIKFHPDLKYGLPFSKVKRHAALVPCLRQAYNRFLLLLFWHALPVLQAGTGQTESVMKRPGEDEAGRSFPKRKVTPAEGHAGRPPAESSPFPAGSPKPPLLEEPRPRFLFFLEIGSE